VLQLHVAVSVLQSVCCSSALTIGCRSPVECCIGCGAVKALVCCSSVLQLHVAVSVLRSVCCSSALTIDCTSPVDCCIWFVAVSVLQ